MLGLFRIDDEKYEVYKKCLENLIKQLKEINEIDIGNKK